MILSFYELILKMLSPLKRLERLRLPRISDWVLPDDAPSGNEFLYEAIDSIDVNTLKDISDTKSLEFDQGKYTLTKSACTIVNSGRALLKVVDAYYGYKPTNQDIFDMVEYAVDNMWYVVGTWWYGYKGVDACRKYWNEKHPDMKVTSYLINYNDSNEDFVKLGNKGYLMAGSYNGSTAYNNDFRSDAVLNGKSFWPRVYWHRTTRERIKNEWHVNDSYTGNFYNIYKLLFPKEIIANRVRSGSFYFFAPMNNNSAEIKRLTAQKKETNDAITANSNSWHLEKDTKYQKELNTMNNTLRKKLELIESQLKVL